jgi:hypothetical protein
MNQDSYSILESLGLLVDVHIRESQRGIPTFSQSKRGRRQPGAVALPLILAEQAGVMRSRSGNTAYRVERHECRKMLDAGQGRA